MQAHTKFGTLGEMVTASQLVKEDATSEELAAALQVVGWNQFVSSNSTFGSWGEMMGAAATERLKKAFNGRDGRMTAALRNAPGTTGSVVRTRAVSRGLNAVTASRATICQRADHRGFAPVRSTEPVAPGAGQPAFLLLFDSRCPTINLGPSITSERTEAPCPTCASRHSLGRS
jgi:hypothetical protein